MKTTETEYNGIKIIHDVDRSLAELDTSMNGVTTDIQFVMLIIKFQSCFKYKNIRYFVLTKKNNDFELSPEYYKFRLLIFLEDLLLKGVKQIFYLVSENKTEKYKKNLPGYVQTVSNYEQIEEMIKKIQEKENNNN